MCLSAIIGPVLLQKTVNSGQYVSDILHPFFNQLTTEERQYKVISSLQILALLKFSRIKQHV
jgi:hypothetical protein